MQPNPSFQSHAIHEILDMEGHGGLVIVTKEGMAVRADSGTIQNSYGKEFTDPPVIRNAPAYGLAKVGAMYSLISGSSHSINLPATLFDEASEGEIAVLARFASQTSFRGIVTTDRAATVSKLTLLKNQGGAMSFLTHDGTNTETLSSSGGVITNDQWHLVGCGWGPLGKRMYVDGVLVASDATKTFGVGATTDQPAMGIRTGPSYTTMDVAAFVVFNKQYGDWLHDAWQREPLLSAAA